MIWHAQQLHGIQGTTEINWLKLSLQYHDTSSTVHIPVGTSPLCAIKVDMHRGSTLSPFPFVLCMDIVTADF